MNDNTQYFDMAILTFDKVVKAYNGRSGCMCGCNGDYAYTGDHGQSSWQGEINLVKAKRRFSNVMRNPNAKVDDFGDLYCAWVDDGNRTTAVYFGK